jgi:hypothetical protein
MANFFQGGILRWNRAVLSLLLVSCFHSFGSPLPIVGSQTGILDRLGQWSMIRFCNRQHLDDQILQSFERHHIILSDAHLSAMNLLYEFASGTGPVSTYWLEYHPYTQAIQDGIGIRHVCKWYVDMQSSETFQPAPNIRYQASATVIPPKPSTWYFAFEQNIRLLRDRNYSQFILGSFNVRVDTMGGDEFKFTLKNRMSRKSLFIGLGPRVQRPRALGTTFQNISFTLSKKEILEKAEMVRNRKD